MDFMIFMIAPPLAVKMLASHSGLDALSDYASGLCCSISDADRATPPANRVAGSRCEAPTGRTTSLTANSIGPNEAVLLRRVCRF
jgi:hypothetical protein